jgi:hypothetical protein
MCDTYMLDMKELAFGIDACHWQNSKSFLRLKTKLVRSTTYNEQTVHAAIHL